MELACENMDGEKRNEEDGSNAERRLNTIKNILNHVMGNVRTNFTHSDGEEEVEINEFNEKI